MSPRPLKISALCTTFAIALGCGSSPPPPKPPESVATAATSEPEPPKPPPPKCEKLEEKCEAKGSTRAKVAHTSLAVTPVSGWMYAQEEAVTIAQASDTGPGMAFTGFEADAKDTKKDTAGRDAAFGELTKRLGIEAGKPPKKVNWKKPDGPKSVSEFKLDLWELKGFTRASKKGTLVVVAGVVDDKGVMAISFAPEDDKSADEAIVKSFDSIGKAE